MDEKINCVGVIEISTSDFGNSDRKYAFLIWFDTLQEIIDFVATNSLPSGMGTYFIKELWEIDMRMKSSLVINYQFNKQGFFAGAIISDNEIPFAEIKINSDKSSCEVKFLTSE